MKRIALIGSTGSIGRQACAVVRRNRKQLKIESLVAFSDGETLLRQIEEFHPTFAALVSEESGRKIAPLIPKGVRFVYGKEAALSAVEFGDVALIAATGFAGLAYTLRAVECKKDIALANKETLVCGGELVMRKIKGAAVRLMPIDSEHSALWQALSFRLDAPFKRLILTASGGPFYGKTKEELASVTPADALKHPTWQMGAKITIDSATLLNKGFEVIEAKWLYGAPLEKIHAIVHPESIIHSMVEFEDGGVLAQMSEPSMELPIQLALTYPERLDCNLRSLDFEKLGSLRFLPLERKAFPCFDLALSAAEAGENYPCALNAAGEIAVQAFLQGRIGFNAIAETIEETLSKNVKGKADGFEALLETDERAREIARAVVGKRRGAR